MKWTCFLLFGSSLVAGAVEDAKLPGMLAVAVTNQGSGYLAARESMLALGTSVLPALGRCAVAADLSWQQRLVARICCERLARTDDIQALRRYDWSKDPGYQKDWERNILGPGHGMGAIVIPKCRDLGLWYYYVELTWKETGEVLSCEDGRVRARWADWCLAALADTPERYWYPLAVSERMLASPFSGWHVARYQTFLRDKNASVVPILVRFYDSYNKSEVIGPEMFPGRHSQLYCGMFAPILSFADSRHADLLEKFISEKPDLAPLKDRVATVRSRPAPPVQLEPSFRLGTNLVAIVP